MNSGNIGLGQVQTCKLAGLKTPEPVIESGVERLWQLGCDSTGGEVQKQSKRNQVDA